MSADSLKVGERVRLTLAAERAEDRAVQFPDPNAGPAVFGALTVLDRSPVRTRRIGAGRAVDSVAYTVTTFALDSVRVPALPVQAVAGRDTVAAASAPRTLPVVSVVGPDAAGLRPGAPLASFPGPWGPWLLGAALAAVAGGGGYWWWRRYHYAPSDAPITSTATAASPYAAGMARLRDLRNVDLTAPDAVESFYVELSAIVRSYLAERLDVAAREHTTREVVEVLRRRDDVPSDATKCLQAVLERADLVKFAGTRPAPDASMDALQAARTALDTIEKRAQGDEAPSVDAVAGASAPASPP